MKRLIVLFIKFYQLVLSPLMGPGKCRFHPTCSNYFIESVNKKGLIKGSFYGFLRILKCHPFSKKSGFDPVK